MLRFGLRSSVCLLLACGGTESSDTTTSMTTEGSSSTTVPGSTETSSTTPAETSSGEASTNATTTGGGAACASNDDCESSEYCDFPFDSCGAGGSEGSCVARPTDCAPDERPICGCNDQLYPSACDAASTGVDLSFLGECELPNGAFACGPSFCVLGMEYCAITSGTQPTAECIELPPACLPPQCACMTECCGCTGPSCCAEFCTSDGEALTFTCPAG
ncbi:MAG TPA: hypothetical protein VG755_28890 [Nannocystaceae bacterium]|nr:hypothetical protein [Nannocystaceae bacterium]